MLDENFSLLSLIATSEFNKSISSKSFLERLAISGKDCSETSLF